jgi:hypothetical protein
MIREERGSSRLVDMSPVWSVGGTGLNGCRSSGWRLGVRSAGGWWRVLILGDSIRCWGRLERFGYGDCGKSCYGPLVFRFMGSGSSSRVRVGEACRI